MNPQDLNQHSSPFDDDEEAQDLSFSSENLVKRRTEEDDADVAVSDNPCLDSLPLKRQRLGDDKDSDKRFASNSSSSPCKEEHLAAMILLELALATWKTQTRTQSQKSLNFDCYKCRICGKEFSSYQALGGHKASHKFDKQQPVENADASERTQRKTMLPSGEIHECSVCHKIFESGQALGGHKRLHYEGTNIGGHKRSQKKTVVTRDKWSPSNGNSVKYVLNQEHKLRESEGVVIGGRKRSPDKVVSEGDKCSPGSNGSALINESEQEQSVSRSFDLNKPPLREIDEVGGGGDVKEVESAVI